MNYVFLFCSKLRVYLTEVPVLILLAIALRYNESSDELLKLYPLVIFLSLAVIFIAVYFFRAILISNSEIRLIGAFSSQDSADIAKDRMLTLTPVGGHSIRVELIGGADEEPAFEWMREENSAHRDISLFRGKAIGGTGAIRRVLAHFGMPEGDSFSEDGYSFENDNVIISTEVKDGNNVYVIKFKNDINGET